jgi:mannosyl-3-phosphoglycerate phosphatase
MTSVRGLFFTDLDGTLLDHHTYRPSPRAIEIIGGLTDGGVLTVPVTSKTAAEVRELTPEFGIVGWAVVEGGGVVVAPDGAEALTTTDDRETLIRALDDLAGNGFVVRGAHAMDPPEFARRTGLSEARAARALARSASEPFVFEGDEDRARAMVTAARDLGVSITRGGRFWHLQPRGVDKAVGAQRIMDRLGLPNSPPRAAVGDAWNDLPLLAWADHGYLLGDAVAAADVPDGVERIPAGGPAGFEEAAGRFAALLGLTLPAIER